MKTFTELGLCHPLLQALTASGYSTATPIQAFAIPLLLEGKDLMGCAQTGTGKTAAFALPTLQRLAADQLTEDGHLKPSAGREEPAQTASNSRDDRRDYRSGPRGRDSRGRDFRSGPGNRRDRRAVAHGPKREIRCLVLAPTRELSVQIEKSFMTYGEFLRLRVGVVHGGVSQVPQVRMLERGVDILVATPGRLLDLMNQGHISLSEVRTLILDEADQMLDMGFLPDLHRIVSTVPSERQTMMFSATMPPEIRDVASKWLNNPEMLQVAGERETADNVEQSVFFVAPNRKSELLAAYLKSSDQSRTIVFVRTKHSADKIVDVLERNDIDAVSIHSNKSQAARTRSLSQFKSKRPPVLVATDIAARGLDVSNVTHVINYDLPMTPEIYVHRIGRTGRAEASGKAISFCCLDERGHLRRIERTTDCEITVDKSMPELTLEAPDRRERSSTDGYNDGGRGVQRGSRNGNSRRSNYGGNSGERSRSGSRPARSEGTREAYPTRRRADVDSSRNNQNSRNGQTSRDTGSARTANSYKETNNDRGTQSDTQAIAPKAVVREVRPAKAQGHASGDRAGVKRTGGKSNAYGKRFEKAPKPRPKIEDRSHLRTTKKKSDDSNRVAVAVKPKKKAKPVSAAERQKAEYERQARELVYGK